MYQAIIIADDFSSVTDCGVQFATHGLATLALMSLPERLPEGDVLSVDTDSRPLSPVTAYKKVYRTAAALRGTGCRRIYKSVDSTLRGNLGAEIDAVMDALELPVALIAPAFPHYGRTIVDGTHYLMGLPLAESSLARDPVSPMRESELGKILRSQSKRTIAHIPLSVLHAGQTALHSVIAQHIEGGATLLTFDTETEQDLQTIADFAFAMPEALIVGSTGLAQYIAEGWKIGSGRAEMQAPRQTAPLLFAAASASPVTAKQIERLICCENVCPVKMEPWELAKTQGKAHLDAARQALLAGWDVVLYLDNTPAARERSRQSAMTHGVLPEALPGMIAQAMAAMTRELVETGLPGGLLMTGGDTAKAVCTALKSDGMELLGELEPGIPYGWLTGSRRLLGATKAGAFGTPEALITARNTMRSI